MVNDNWDEWFRRRRPYFRSDFNDIERIFREIQEEMNREFNEFFKRVPKELVREKTMPNGTRVREWGPFIYGYSVHIGPDGKPEIREFGNIKPQAQLGEPRVELKAQREPLVDVMEDKDEIRVIAELPGVNKEDIKIKGTEYSLTIDVNTPERKYHKRLELPAAVNLEETKAKYKNGVLEITLKKKKNDAGKEIKL